MSQQKDLLREIAAATSQGDASDRISDWFTEDFRLHEPGKPALPVGHEGASQMRSFLRTPEAAHRGGNPRYDRGGRSSCCAVAGDRNLLRRPTF